MVINKSAPPPPQFSVAKQTPEDICLVGGFNPSEKYARQIGSFPQIGMNIKMFETTNQYLFINLRKTLEMARRFRH